MPKKIVIEQHITQGPYRVKSGDRITAKRFIATGSSYGRFIFVDRPPLMEMPDDVVDVVISHCDFIGMPHEGSALSVIQGAMGCVTTT